MIASSYNITKAQINPNNNNILELLFQLTDSVISEPNDETAFENQDIITVKKFQVSGQKWGGWGKINEVSVTQLCEILINNNQDY